MIEALGIALAVASILPVALQRFETCFTTALGLGALCLYGVAMATGTGNHTREWLLGGGVVLTLLGTYLQRRHRRTAR